MTGKLLIILNMKVNRTFYAYGQLKRCGFCRKHCMDMGCKTFENQNTRKCPLETVTSCVIIKGKKERNYADHQIEQQKTFLRSVL